MIAFGYVRVSGQGQIDGDGPERQKEAILRFCHKFDLGEPSLFCELGVTGTLEAMDREEFVRMITAIDQVRALSPGVDACIVVEKLDRLARTLFVSEALLMECARRKIPVFSADQGALVDLADANDEPMRKAFRQIGGVFAELDKSLIVHRLKVARERKKLLTGRCGGQIPYGADEYEVQVRTFLVEQRALGLSLAAIAKAANARGYYTRNRQPWTRGAVDQMLTRRGVALIPSGIVTQKEQISASQATME